MEEKLDVQTIDLAMPVKFNQLSAGCNHSLMKIRQTFKHLNVFQISGMDRTADGQMHRQQINTRPPRDAVFDKDECISFVFFMQICIFFFLGLFTN